MTDLLDFLRARLDDDERIALAATPGPWEARDDDLDGWSIDPLVAWPGYDVRSGVDKQFDAEHIARHDPARVLREVDAARQLVELHRPVRKRSTGSDGGIIEDCQTCDHFPAQYPCATMRLLALPHSDHPDYRDDWRPA